MSFYADLHVHSKFARATSRDADLEHMALWAAKKGITVIGTGDFTHPGWLAEIKEKLVPAEPGLFRLKPELESEVQRRVPAACVQPTRFMLEVEISTIYKKGELTRKVHHLIYVPDIQKADALVERLSRIGNLTADGRPILGLDSRDLLEITLECGEGAYLVPAHIWTPWFAVLGSKSGFNSIEACYGDLSHHIFALETGLSSDPPMNRRLSSLDRYQLVSNSDAHSPSKLGREACSFSTDLDYFAIRHALETGKGYDGTVEFFPEEGKYHCDGHRKCGVLFEPETTRRNNGNCPVCQKPLTLGVLHRVAALADRPADSTATDAPQDTFHSFVPLTEVLAEIHGVGPASKRVQQAYENLVSHLGSEFFILEKAPPEEVRRVGHPLLAEGLKRMREGNVKREAGFDGQYGTIRLFSDDELLQGASVGLLFDPPPAQPKTPNTPAPAPTTQSHTKAATENKKIAAPSASNAKPTPSQLPNSAPDSNGILDRLDPEQRRAAELTEGPLRITAGPGTGKTRTLTHRIAHLIAHNGVAPNACLALTFTNRAADEMRERLKTLLSDGPVPVPVMTFHSLGYTIVQEHSERLGLPPSFRIAATADQIALVQDSLSLSEAKAQSLLKKILRLKAYGTSNKRQNNGTHDTRIAELHHARTIYQAALHKRGLVDFDDLINLTVELLEKDTALAAAYRARYRYISIDEYQDVDARQYRLIRSLVPPDGNLCVIGDPDQSIYSFRGAEVHLFEKFSHDFPNTQTVQLVRNYRSGQMIVNAAQEVIAPSTLVERRQTLILSDDTTKITLHQALTDKAEAEFIVHTIEQTIGGSTFFSMDSGRVDGSETSELSFSDFAILYRTDAQADCLKEAFDRSGIPYQKHSHAPLIEHPLVDTILKPMRELPEQQPLQEHLHIAASSVDAAIRERCRAFVTATLQPLAQDCCNDRERFEAELALRVESDLWDPRAERVSLLTLHAAKGLEFKVVFIVGCEEGIVPLSWDGQDPETLAEERRLFFVGVTRARERLILSNARRRLWRGKVRQQQPSSFLKDIREHLMERQQQAAKKSLPPQPKQMELF